MTTRRDGRILVLLMLNAAFNAMSTASFMTEVAPHWLSALAAMLAGMFSAATGVYVVATRETQQVPPVGIPAG
jgi:hypothetical protein